MEIRIPSPSPFFILILDGINNAKGLSTRLSVKNTLALAIYIKFKLSDDVDYLSFFPKSEKCT